MDPFVKSFMNMFNIARGKLHPNSYRILTGHIELVHKEGRESDLDMFRYMYNLNKKKGELIFFLSTTLNHNLFIKLLDLYNS